MGTEMTVELVSARTESDAVACHPEVHVRDVATEFLAASHRDREARRLIQLMDEAAGRYAAMTQRLGIVLETDKAVRRRAWLAAGGLDRPTRDSAPAG